MYHTISKSGDAEGWNVAFYVFTACRSLLFFVVIILLATGEQRAQRVHGPAHRGVNLLAAARRRPRRLAPW